MGAPTGVCGLEPGSGQLASRDPPFHTRLEYLSHQFSCAVLGYHYSQGPLIHNLVSTLRYSGYAGGWLEKKGTWVDKRHSRSQECKGRTIVAEEVVGNIRGDLKEVKVPLFVVPCIDPLTYLLDILA